MLARSEEILWLFKGRHRFSDGIMVKIPRPVIAVREYLVSGTAHVTVKGLLWVTACERAHIDSQANVVAHDDVTVDGGEGSETSAYGNGHITLRKNAECFIFSTSGQLVVEAHDISRVYLMTPDAKANITLHDRARQELYPQPE